MTEFRRTFAVWFVSLIALFVALNLLGFVPHDGKGHSIGVPCQIAEWETIGEYRSETRFYASSIFTNVAVSVGISAAIALVCALAHARHSSVGKGVIARTTDDPESPSHQTGACNGRSALPP